MLNVGGEPQPKSGLPRWEFFMADPPTQPADSDVIVRQPMEQVKGCDHFATSGNVILSPEVWALIGKDCDGEKLEHGFIRLNRLLGKSEIVVPEQKKILEYSQVLFQTCQISFIMLYLLLLSAVTSWT
jgi:hypothetical protein